MMSSLTRAIVGAAAAVAITNADSAVKNPSTNAVRYLEGVAGYNMQYGKCVRAKVPSDDDDEEGNSYFYNGRYYAQYLPYASFFLCDSSCESCDYSVEYVTDLDTYLQANVDYVQNYCQKCAAQCGNGRRLEDDEEEENEQQNIQVDCETCPSQCDYLINSSGGNDETAYLDCQEAFAENNIQYYSGPSCDTEGNIIIGYFYDDECTIKAKVDYNDFSYDTFRTMQEFCMDCSSTDTCGDLYDDATQCIDGSNANGDEDDMPICSTYKAANRERTYAKRRRKLNFVPLVLFVLFLLGGFAFGSYSYFLRHREKAPLAEQDHAPMSDLPALT